jgi:rfaE bifunctional protein nucleotidyltransferase chain/domain
VTLAAGADWETALRMANAAAAVAVGKKGTAIVTSGELRRKILPHAFLAAEEKIVAADGDLDGHLLEWRKQGLRIGFTNGCFDILHPGHVKVLTAARAACDRLIVGLNSDASVKRLKGEGRPVQDERARSEVLAALEAVDLVAIFEEDTPLELIARIRPTVLVKPAAAKCCWSISCPASARHRWSSAHAETRRERAGEGVGAGMVVAAAAAVAGPGRVVDELRRFRDPDRRYAAVVDLAGLDLRGSLAGLDGALP